MSFLSGAAGGQSNFNAKAATGDAQFHEQNLQPAINTAQSDYSKQLGMANSVFGQQGDLASQLRDQSMGQGPNIAAMQLQQATDRNNQQAAGQIASQRGLNPALAARLIAQNQAANNQQAAGQSGLMRAQQQLNAQNALANVYQQQVGNAQGGGSLANQNLGINQQAQSSQNQQIVQAKGKADELNQKTAEENAKAAQSASGGFLGGLGSVMSSPLLKGALAASTGGSSLLLDAGTAAAGKAMAFDGGEIPAFLKGGSVDAVVSPGERVLSKKEAEEVRKEGKNPTKMGHKVPGKAPVEGNDIRNDIVDAKLKPGTVVVPRSVENSEDPELKGKEFIKALKEHKEPGPKGFAKVLEMKRKIDEVHGHISDLHAMMKKVK